VPTPTDCSREYEVKISYKSFRFYIPCVYQEPITLRSWESRRHSRHVPDCNRGGHPTSLWCSTENLQTDGRVRDQKDGLAQTRPLRLHLDENKPRSPKGLAAPHRQGSGSKLPMRLPIPKRGPHYLRLPTARQGKEGFTGVQVTLGGARFTKVEEGRRGRQSLGYHQSIFRFPIQRFCWRKHFVLVQGLPYPTPVHGCIIFLFSVGGPIIAPRRGPHMGNEYVKKI